MIRRAAAWLLLALGAVLLGGEAAWADLPLGAPGGNGNGPLTVQDNKDLRFGTVIAGFPTSVPWTDPQCGRWFIRGRPGAEVMVDFVQLPSSLVGGGWTMPITYGPDAAAWNTKNQKGGATSFDPNAGAVLRLDPQSGSLVIWIGGTVAPPPNQQPGNYEADIVLDVYYTGN
jgi:hypothetical protein